ncbi:hypothetical protein CEP54_016339 [Fusarium duplospermum]|uniref:Uncharacterized protein n=1 Tax=Fusarium duplospermum TaxID=1325734 RepID=A0A428NF37_9HYPO|nr:hypothetical protein CEP54_016339 [Fusarium duplospermum]
MSFWLSDPIEDRASTITKNTFVAMIESRSLYVPSQLPTWPLSSAASTGKIGSISAYHIPEMATGWGSDLMKDELTFLIFDGAMILIAISKRGQEQVKGEDAIPLR